MTDVGMSGAARSGSAGKEIHMGFTSITANGGERFLRIKDQYRAHRLYMAMDWTRYDRIMLTEKQATEMAERVIETGYFSSDTLLHPSIPRFTAIIRGDDPRQNTYVFFQETIMDPEDFEIEDPRLTLTPLVDAYVFANNEGHLCNYVITFCKCELKAGGRVITSTAQPVTYSHDDPMTEFMLDQEQFTQDFARSMKCLYMAVQMMSIERPEVILTERTERVETDEVVTRKGSKKPRRSTRLVRVLRISDDGLSPSGAKGHHTITCPCWGVAGHWRTYKKTGKQVWIEPYRKGKKRGDAGAYQAKEYRIPE